jgi:hypothetical protein
MKREATEKKRETTEMKKEAMKQGVRSHQVRCEKKLKDMRESSERGAISN